MSGGVSGLRARARCDGPGFFLFWDVRSSRSRRDAVRVEWREDKLTLGSSQCLGSWVHGLRFTVNFSMNAVRLKVFFNREP